MTIKHIVVHVDQTSETLFRVKAATALAARLKAHLTAVYLVPEPYLRGITGYHLPERVVRDHVQHAEAEAEAALKLAHAAAGAEIQFDAVKEVGPLDRLPALFARRVRCADLAVVGEPDRERGAADDAALVETAFMDTGRPALVIPRAGARELPPRRALVAWDGSREAARAAHDALPLLATTDEVVVLTAGTDRADPAASGEPGADLVEHLGRHGISARLKAVQGSGAIADLIAGAAAEEDADLIVMGGYGHSRLREMMLGGVTRHMLERMSLPLLIAH